MSHQPPLALCAPDWLRLVGLEDKAMEYVDLATQIEVIAEASVAGRRFDAMCFLLRDDTPDEEVFLGINATDAQYHATRDLLREKGLKSAVLVSPSWGEAYCPFAEDAGPRDAFVDNFEKACVLSNRLKADSLGISNVIRLDSGTEHINVPAAQFDFAFGRLVETFQRCNEKAVKHSCRIAVEPEPPWFGINTFNNVRHFLEELQGAEAIGLQIDLAHFIHILQGTANPKHAVLPENWSWQRPTDQSAAAWDVTLRQAWQRCVDEFGDAMIDLHVAQSDGTQYGGGDHPLTGRHCKPDDPNGLIDLVDISKLWLCDDQGKPNGKVDAITFDGCMIGEAAVRAKLLSSSYFWGSVLSALIEVQSGCGYANYVDA